MSVGATRANLELWTRRKPVLRNKSSVHHEPGVSEKRTAVRRSIAIIIRDVGSYFPAPNHDVVRPPKCQGNRVSRPRRRLAENQWRLHRARRAKKTSFDLPKVRVA